MGKPCQRNVGYECHVTGAGEELRKWEHSALPLSAVEDPSPLASSAKKHTENINTEKTKQMKTG